MFSSEHSVHTFCDLTPSRG
uniref:Uncharacterized protein n=1 Tax=Anguilla anguilla TaxID=7936 RepID=A0A0E9TRR5_ANGAN